MRTILAGRCVQRTTRHTPAQQQLVTEMRAAVAAPAAHFATKHEAKIIALVLAEFEAELAGGAR